MATKKKTYLSGPRFIYKAKFFFSISLLKRQKKIKEKISAFKLTAHFKSARRRQKKGKIGQRPSRSICLRDSVSKLSIHRSTAQKSGTIFTQTDPSRATLGLHQPTGENERERFVLLADLFSASMSSRRSLIQLEELFNMSLVHESEAFSRRLSVSIRLESVRRKMQTTSSVGSIDDARPFVRKVRRPREAKKNK